MKLLALDTALDACSAAVVEMRDGMPVVLAERHLPMSRGHAEALMPMVEAVMAEAGASFSALDRIAATIGPGTFTGVRIGLAAARGLALAADRPVIGVTTLEAIAANAAEPGANPSRHPILVAIDARRGELYLQSFSPELEPLDEPRALPVERAREALPLEDVLILGTGAALLATAGDSPARAHDPAPPAALPRASRVAARAAVKPCPQGPPEPLYLRAPDAKPQASLLGPLAATERTA